MWDGTDPVDSRELANRLARSFRCVNLLDDSPKGEFGIIGRPRAFQPCGAKGKDVTVDLVLKGMFEFPQIFFDPIHENAGGDHPAILQFSGHGIPGFLFSESGVLFATSEPMEAFLPTKATGTIWNLVNRRWDNPSTKVVIFSACRQLAGKPQQFLWSQRMRGESHRVHTLLSYRKTAPEAKTSAAINKKFVANLTDGQTFIEAWRGAHGDGLRRRWAALAFRSAVEDRLSQWVQDGALPSEPAADEDVLYFDEETRAGRVVTKPAPDFHAVFRFLAAAHSPVPPMRFGQVIPPWTRMRAGTLLELSLHFLHSTFQDGDRVWVAATQVRPDYHKPFRIDRVIRFVKHDDLVATGAIGTFGRIHSEERGYKPDTYSDLYEFEIDRKAMPVGTLDSTFSTLFLQMEIVGKPNNHLPLFYLQFRVERGETEFGIPTKPDKDVFIAVADQRKLLDEPQFCVFLFDQAEVT
jgi:hypothetical protein